MKKLGFLFPPLLLPILLLLPSRLPAQRVYVVDAAGGSGAAFRDLPKAVAFVPSGSFLLVRPGAYRPFQVSGKALRIVGSGPGKTEIQLNPTTLPLSVRKVPKGDVFVMADMDVRIVPAFPYFVPAPYVKIQEGRFFFENFRIVGKRWGYGSLSAPKAHGSGCLEASRVELLAYRFEISAGAGWAMLNPAGVLPAGLYVKDSRIQLTDCGIFGPMGGTVDAYKNGQPGILLISSVLDLFDCDVRGGSGGDGTKSWGFTPGNGAPGIDLRSGSLVLGQGGMVYGGGAGAYQAGLGKWKYGWPASAVYVGAGTAARFKGSKVLGGRYANPPFNRASPWAGAGTCKSVPGPVHRPKIRILRGGKPGKEITLEVKGVSGRAHVLLVGRRGAWAFPGPCWWTPLAWGRSPW